MLVLTLVSFVSAQSQKVPYGEDGFSFHSFSPIYAEYPGTFERIADVDFKNLALRFSHVPQETGSVANLRNGRYEKRNSCMEDVKLEATHVLWSPKADRHYALAIYSWFEACGSSGTTGIAQIFELHNQRLKVVQQLDWDQHFDTKQPYFSYDEKSRTLVVRTAHYVLWNDGISDAHCCASAMDVITLRWSGSRMLRKAMGTELSEYGLREGKKFDP